MIFEAKGQCRPSTANEVRNNVPKAKVGKSAASNSLSIQYVQWYSKVYYRTSL